LNNAAIFTETNPIKVNVAKIEKEYTTVIDFDASILKLNTDISGTNQLVAASQTDII